jgi:hypothetical protein
MIEIIGAVIDPSDSYFFGDWPQWAGWIAGLGMAGALVLYLTGNAWAARVGSILLCFAIWAPLILINLHRPIVAIVITLIAVFICVTTIAGDGDPNEKWSKGVYTSWYPEVSGKPRQKSLEGRYKGKDRIRVGVWTRWYKNDQKGTEKTYEDVRLVTVVGWKPNGEKCPDTNVVDGNGLVVEYNDGGRDGGQKWMEENYKDGKLDGPVIHYWHGTEEYRRIHKDGECVETKYPPTAP